MAEHKLRSVETFTEHRVGWKSLPSGGSVPIIKPLDKPYCRWYCSCGDVGNRSSSAADAMREFAAHLERS